MRSFMMTFGCMQVAVLHGKRAPRGEALKGFACYTFGFAHKLPRALSSSDF